MVEPEIDEENLDDAADKAAMAMEEGGDDAEEEEAA